MSPALTIGEAVVSRLRSDLALRTELGATISDSQVYVAGQVPDVDTLPYVVVGNFSGSPGGPAQAYGAPASEDMQEVRAWGATEWGARRLGSLVEAAMAGPLVLDGFTALKCRLEERRTITDPDGSAVQYFMRYRITTRKAA